MTSTVIKRTAMPAAAVAVDIGVNILNRQLEKDRDAIMARAHEAGVAMIMTGTSLKNSRDTVHFCQQYNKKHASPGLTTCTVGVHPHEAKHYNKDTTAELEKLLTGTKNDGVAIAVGECGLDYNRNFSSREAQLFAFKSQLSLAIRLKLPLFCHERDAHEDFLSVVDSFNVKKQAGGGEAIDSSTSSESLPPLVVHCFTGNESELDAYIARGFYIGLTGTICKFKRGATLRELVKRIPHDRLLIETDAPFMGFVKTRRRSEPEDVLGVASKIAECLGVTKEYVCKATTENASRFFNLDHQAKP
eukprot:m.10178 g.10178  ORF g.10178 m.10178 type:complete len:303 (-) comp4215_c0_seq1:197-1105(-)